MNQKALEPLSQESTKRAVLSHAISSPMTLGLSGLGVLSGSAAAMFHLGPAGIAVGITGIGLGLGSFCYQYFFKREVLAARYIEKVRLKIIAERLAAMQGIKKDLIGLLNIQDARRYTEQAINQFDMSQGRYENLLVLLDRKFNRHELTYGRYVATAEQVFLSVIDNLQRIVDALRSITTIDPAYIIKRMNALNQISKKDQADDKEMATLEQRKQLRYDQLQRINQLLTHNEEAMTVLDRTATAIANISTGSKMAQHDIEAAMIDLIELANRSHIFNE